MSIREIKDRELNLFKDGMWDTLFEIEKLSHKYDDSEETIEALREQLNAIEKVAYDARISLKVITIDSVDEYQ
jgi:hypothetical protein